MRRARAARGRDRAVRRPDAAAARRRPGARRRAPARHERRRDRRRRGPRALRRAARRGSATRRRRTRPRATVEEALAVAARRRLPAARAAQLRARRAGDGDRLLRRATSSGYLAAQRAARSTAARSSSTASSRTRSRSTSTRSATGARSWIGGIMQHVEEAGIHSGDSACVLPPHSLGPEMLERIREQTRGIALALGVVGLLNVQFAASSPRTGELYVIEANPRASRTVPFVSKAIGLPLAKLACRIMLGESIAALGLPADPMSRSLRRGQGGGAAVQPLLRRRLAARARDALDRRGDGHRERLPDGVREGPGGGRRGAARRAAPCSSRSPTPTRRRAPGSPRSCTTSASRSSRPAAPRRRSQRMGVPVTHAAQGRRGLAARRRRDRARRGRPRDQHPDRLRRALGRLGDPPRRGRARDPVHHDAVGRSGRGARDPRGARRRAGGRCRCRRCTARDEARPFGSLGRRTACCEPPAWSGATSCSGPRDELARAQPGPVLHARRGRALGRRGRRAAVPRPRGVGDAGRR